MEIALWFAGGIFLGAVVALFVAAWVFTKAMGRSR